MVLDDRYESRTSTAAPAGCGLSLADVIEIHRDAIRQVVSRSDMAVGDVPDDRHAGLRLQAVDVVATRLSRRCRQLGLQPALLNHDRRRRGRAVPGRHREVVADEGLVGAAEAESLGDRDVYHVIVVDLPCQVEARIGSTRAARSAGIERRIFSGHRRRAAQRIRKAERLESAPLGVAPVIRRFGLVGDAARWLRGRRDGLSWTGYGRCTSILDLDAQARDVIFSVPAARRAVPSLGSRWVVDGHSQGGSTAWRVASLESSMRDPDYLGYDAEGRLAGEPLGAALPASDPGGHRALA